MVTVNVGLRDARDALQVVQAKGVSAVGMSEGREDNGA